MDSAEDRLAAGLPHSEIPGSTIARPSPQLIAACHVLHRLSVPRHPPDALRRLISASSTREAPRTEASALPDTWHPYIDTSPRSRNNPRLRTRRGVPLRPKTAIVPSSHSLHNVQYPRSLPRSAADRSPRISVLSRSSSRSAHPLLTPGWWRRTGSNRRPHACKARALPTELRPHDGWPIAL